MTEDSPVLTTHGIYMSFGGVNVLRDIDFEIYPGEIHGLVGENGAGKSTLLKNIAGVHVPKAGEIRLNGETVSIPNPQAATELQIALIHQEPLTFPDLDVAENIFIGRQPMRRGIRRLDWATMYDRSGEILDSLGVKLDPRAKVRGLSIADQQMVEMAGALSQNAKILLMDEPTAALTPSEVEDLFAIVRLLRDQGTAIIFISHRLEEVFDICDRITILRDGELIGQRMIDDVSVDDVIRMMVGRPLSTLFEKGASAEFGEPVLQVEGLTRALKFDDITFDIRAGEIVGVAGLVGAGRTDVARALFGALEIDSGTIRINGQEAEIDRPRDALKHGMIYVPEDRKQNGLLMPMSVIKNMTLSVLDRLSRNGFLRESLEEEASLKYVDELNIVLRDANQPIRELSGGNQQKVVLSRSLMAEPKVMLLDEPTRGIDIGAKAEVHRLMSELAADGLAIMMISSELPEILAMSDRIIVMREGRISGRFHKNEATAERVIAAATGQVLQEG
ncbi:MAG: sugar ABC transporter ATP-binding protein [Chloroflexota bacterium]|nr:MAG: sugar ABC transporter ATP-binding protein [Chloroflexota bacterium]